MLLIARILSLFSPLAIAGTLALLFLSAGSFYYAAAASLAILVLSLWALVKLNLKSQDLTSPRFPSRLGRSEAGAGEAGGDWSYIFQPALLAVGFLLLFIFLENFWFKIGLWLLVGLALFFYYDGVFKIFYARRLGEEKFSNYRLTLAALSVFCFSSGLFGLKDFAGLNIWLMVGAIWLIIFLLNWLNWKKPSPKSALVYAALSAVIAAEIFWSIGNLAPVYYVKGLVFSLFNLGLTVSLTSQLDRNWSGSRVKNYLLVIGGLILLALATARWF